MDKESGGKATTILTLVSSSEKEKAAAVPVWSDFFLANWFFTWVAPIITAGRNSHVNDLKFRLRQQETARINVNRLDQAWSQEIMAHKE